MFLLRRNIRDIDEGFCVLEDILYHLCTVLYLNILSIGSNEIGVLNLWTTLFLLYGLSSP
jgi:hypothetical protein